MTPPTQTPERGTALVERVCRELEDHLADADRHARAYVREYVAACMTSTTSRPTARGLHPQIAKLVRELVLDADASDRRRL